MVSVEREEKAEKRKDYIAMGKEMRRKNKIYHKSKQAIAKHARDTVINVGKIYGKEKAKKKKLRASKMKWAKAAQNRRHERIKKRNAVRARIRERRNKKRVILNKRKTER